MSEMDFYIEGLQQLPAVIESDDDQQEQFAELLREFLWLNHTYESALEVVKTYLNILDDEFNVKFQRNPIHNIEGRIKSAESIIGKLQKKVCPLPPNQQEKIFLTLQE